MITRQGVKMYVFMDKQENLSPIVNNPVTFSYLEHCSSNTILKDLVVYERKCKNVENSMVYPYSNITEEEKARFH